MAKVKPFDFAKAVATKVASFTPAGTNRISAALVDQTSASIKRRRNALDVDMHAAAVGAIIVSIQHGDVGAAVRLVNSLPRGTRAKTLVAWFGAFSNIVLTWDGKASEFKGKLRKSDAEDYIKNPDVAKAQATPFWTEPEKVDPGAFNDHAFAAAVAKLIKRAEGDNAKLTDAGRAALADLKVLNTKLPELAK